MSDRAAKWMRWIARVLGSSAGAYWSLALIGQAAFGDERGISLEGAMLIALVAVTVLGVLLAWWREGLGGAVAVVGALALGAFAYISAGRNKALIALVVGMPFLISGGLFLASWRGSRLLPRNLPLERR